MCILGRTSPCGAGAILSLSVVVVVGCGRCLVFMHSFFGWVMAGRRCNLVNKNKQGHAI